MPSVANAFARALRAAGIARVYGLPGEDHLRLLDALPRAGLTYVGAREESAAALMAATEAAATGLPGVVLVTIAPGLTNTINAIAHAWLDHVPLLIVCGQHAPERAPIIVRQHLDNHRLVDSITKWTVTASPRIHQVLARALETALAPPAGPVLLELRDDVAAAEALDALQDWPPLLASPRLDDWAPRSASPPPPGAQLASPQPPDLLATPQPPGAHLTRPDPPGAHLTSPDLPGAQVATSQPPGAEMASADLPGAHLTSRRTIWPTGRVLEHTLPPALRQVVAQAHRPTIIVGGACPTDEPTRGAIRVAAKQFNAPILCSPSAMGIATPDDAWFAGTFLNGNLEAELLSRSDLIFTLGLDAKDFFNAAWRYTAPIVAINAEPDTQRFAPTTYQLIGGTAPILEALACGSGPAASEWSLEDIVCGSGPAASEWSLDDIAAYRASVRASFHLDDDDAFTIPSALRLARALLPADTRVAVDAGFGKPIAAYLWTAAKPNLYFSAHGLSTMGYALPAANALQLTYPGQPVVGFMGDGSLLMRASELSVAAEHGIAPIWIAWMDGALAQIETKQLRQELQPVGARLPRVSCSRLAEAFGVTGVDVASLAEFDDALQAALREKQATLIGARVDQSRRGEWYELLRG